MVDTPKPKEGIYIFNGRNNNVYFELITSFQNDSVYSYIVDELIGFMPGFKNSKAEYNRIGSLSEDNIYKLLNFGKKNVQLANDQELIPLKLVSFISNDYDYLNSLQYEVDFFLRQNNNDTNNIIIHLERHESGIH